MDVLLTTVATSANVDTDDTRNAFLNDIVPKINDDLAKTLYFLPT